VKRKGSWKNIHQEKRKERRSRNHNRVVNPEEEGEINRAGGQEEGEITGVRTSIRRGVGNDTVTSHCSKDSGCSILNKSRAWVLAPTEK